MHSRTAAAMRKTAAARASRRSLKASPVRVDRAAQKAGKMDTELYDKLQQTYDVMSAMLGLMRDLDRHKLPRRLTADQNDRLDTLYNRYGALTRRIALTLDDAKAGTLEAHDYAAITQNYTEANAVSGEFWKIAGLTPGS